MTDITELAKKHGASYDRNINGDTVLFMTPDQLQAIIKEASAPLVDELKLRVDEETNRLNLALREQKVFTDLGLFEARGSLEKMLRNSQLVLAEFNKEFGNDRLRNHKQS